MCVSEREIEPSMCMRGREKEVSIMTDSYRQECMMTSFLLQREEDEEDKSDIIMCSCYCIYQLP